MRHACRRTHTVADRFTRFKVLRALWARARSLMAWLAYPKSQEARRAAERWSRIQIAERHLRDGVVRGSGDPDSYSRPMTMPAPESQPRQPWQAQWQQDFEAQCQRTADTVRQRQEAQYQAQWESQREAQQRWADMQRNGAQRRR